MNPDVMEAPYTIASLSKPLDSEHGAVHASSVHGIAGSKKRKRHEVAVGVDGEDVRVYNIQSPETVTSYAIAPQSYLCCPPCSVHVRRSKPAKAQRRTYLVLRNGPQDKKRKLVCFTEDKQKDVGMSDMPSGPRKQERRLQGGEVLGVEVVPNQSDGEDETPHVLVSYADGKVDFLSADLSKLIWHHGTSAPGDDSYEHAGLTDTDTARKGLLAGREDVLASLDTGAVSTPASTQLLYRVLRSSGGKRTLQLYSLRPTAVDTVQSQKPGMQHLADFELPIATKMSHDRASYEVHAASGKVHQLLNGRLTVWDLSATPPAPRHDIWHESRSDHELYPRIWICGASNTERQRCRVRDALWRSARLCRSAGWLRSRWAETEARGR